MVFDALKTILALIKYFCPKEGENIPKIMIFQSMIICGSSLDLQIEEEIQNSRGKKG